MKKLLGPKLEQSEQQNNVVLGFNSKYKINLYESVLITRTHIHTQLNKDTNNLSRVDLLYLSVVSVTQSALAQKY